MSQRGGKHTIWPLNNEHALSGYLDARQRATCCEEKRQTRHSVAWPFGSAWQARCGERLRGVKEVDGRAAA